MKLASIAEYITAVSEMLHRQGRNSTTANVYLSSEDPYAIREFLKVAPPAWKIYTDRSTIELDEFRPLLNFTRIHQPSFTSRNTKGRAGLVNLASLLVALEANYFVLTTGSNWSRLMNELRKNILDPLCGNCTQIIDLRPGEWR